MKYKKIAIVGSGISGLAVAHSLKGQADISLFEAGAYFGAIQIRSMSRCRPQKAWSRMALTRAFWFSMKEPTPT
jgi:glycine/D-amino acid oxidase-like deaminating enzyme